MFFLVTPQNFSPLVVVLGIHIILDLTPNYRGQNAWFLPAQADVVAAKVKVSFVVGGRLWIHSQQALCALSVALTSRATSSHT